MKNRETIKPCDLVKGEELLHNNIYSREPITTYDELIIKIYKIKPETLEEKRMSVEGFVLGDGSLGF